MITLRIVNKGLVNEPEYAVFQDPETNFIYEFSNVNGESIPNNDLTHPIIQQILNNGHQVQAEVGDDGMVTLYF